MSIIIKDRYSPRDLLEKQDEVRKLARALLDCEHFADLLLDRSFGNLGRAMSALVSAMSDLRQQQIAMEELDAADLEKVTTVDAEQAFRMLIEHFGDQCIYELVREYDTTNNAA